MTSIWIPATRRIYYCFSIIKHYVSFIVPSTPPPNITLTSNSSTTIRIDWRPIDAQNTNGNISGYLVFYREVLGTGENYDVMATSDLYAEMENLKPGTEYAVRVLGYNEKGNGIASRLYFERTLVAGKSDFSFTTCLLYTSPSPRDS